MIHSEGPVKSANKDQSLVDKLCTAQGHTIAHLERQLAVANDALSREQLQRKTVEAEMQLRYCRTHAAALSTPGGTDCSRRKETEESGITEAQDCRSGETAWWERRLYL